MARTVIPAPQVTQTGTAVDVALSVENLRVQFTRPEGTVHAVNGVSLQLRRGETLGLVGESGSGKSITARTALGLQPAGAQVMSGEVWLDGRNLLAMGEADLRNIRGNDIAMIFQDPMTSMNPVFTVGTQIADVLRAHDETLSRHSARDRAVELLASVGVPQPALRASQYPLQFSGGMRQRAMIAMAIANRPAVLVADEPTTALDVTVQAQVLEVLVEAQRSYGASMLLITHDLGVIAERADRVAVMYAGRVVETADVQTLFRESAHPYFRSLLASRSSMALGSGRLAAIPGEPPNLLSDIQGCPFAPRCPLSKGRTICREELPLLRSVAPGHVTACHFAEELIDGTGGGGGRAPSLVGSTPDQRDPSAATSDTSATSTDDSVPNALEVDSLVKHFKTHRWSRNGKGRVVHALDDVSLAVATGETLGLVGESGCGKSTVGRVIMRLEPVTAGIVRYGGTDVTNLSKRAMRRLRGQVQIVFQDPYSSLNPKMTIRDAVGEPLAIQGVRQPELDNVVNGLLREVGIDPRLANRFAHEFSGGQRQRIAIARSLALRPKVVVLDEPVSSLDVSAQAQVLNLLRDLREEQGLGMLFISHALSVVRHVCDRVAVMYLGEVVETGSAEELFDHASHPYTQALLSAVPQLDPGARDGGRRIILKGDVPDPSNPPSGCRFRTRCWKAQDICATEKPELIAREGVLHPVACHFASPAPAAPEVNAEA
jgi:peptide/nickel transport system ATP-binding protein